MLWRMQICERQLRKQHLSKLWSDEQSANQQMEFRKGVLLPQQRLKSLGVSHIQSYHVWLVAQR